MHSTADAAGREVWDFVQRLNRCWTEGEPEKLRTFFHPDIVIVQPGFQGRAAGRDAAVASYVEFVAQAKVLAFEEKAEHVDVFGDTAVVSYTFEIAYEAEGRRLIEQGRDLFVLRRENRRWRAVWRTLLPESPEP
jgi:uncharacterized protein (TIGR02246 family)